MAKQIFDAVKLGNTIRKKRKELGYTQLSLSEKVKCTEVYMNNIECGKHLPSNKLMKKIFDVLEMKIIVTVE
jgi:transcriptional regulator with XRE-family HTH domain